MVVSNMLILCIIGLMIMSSHLIKYLIFIVFTLIVMIALITQMLEDRGNTAVYLLYSLTRIRSVPLSSKLMFSFEL